MDINWTDPSFTGTPDDVITNLEIQQQCEVGASTVSTWKRRQHPVPFPAPVGYVAARSGGRRIHVYPKVEVVRFLASLPTQRDAFQKMATSSQEQAEECKRLAGEVAELDERIGLLEAELAELRKKRSRAARIASHLRAP